MLIKKLRNDLTEYLLKRNLTQKFVKAENLINANPLHPSLNVELLEPRHRLIYSFRIDRKYRAIFIYTSSDEIEIIAFTNHYR